MEVTSFLRMSVKNDPYVGVAQVTWPNIEILETPYNWENIIGELQVY